MTRVKFDIFPGFSAFYIFDFLCTEKPKEGLKVDLSSKQKIE